MTKTLRQQIGSDSLVVAPGVYDALTARLVDQAGFSAMYLSGGCTSASLLGQPDLGFMSFTEICGVASRITAITDVPLVADADTGYGNELGVVRTIKSYERAGVAGIHLEDQVFPKRCGHLPGKEVIDAADYERKLAAALDARDSDDFIIIARTDSRSVLGLDEAIDRANRYASVGADLVFVEAPESMEDLETLSRQIEAPQVVNLMPNSKTPLLSTEQAANLGFSLAIYPMACVTPVILGIERALKEFHMEGMPPEWTHTVGPTDLFERVGLSDWEKFRVRITPSA